MKSWADVSSDEESFDGISTEIEQQKLEEASARPPAAVHVTEPAAEEEEPLPVEGEAAAPPPTPVERTYDFPDKPPFTAFIGNLAYSIKEPAELKEAVAQCAKDKLGEEVTILGGRISFGRDGNHRGFGYVEVETLDQLKLLMKLNDEESMIAGRKLQVNTANGPPQRGNRRGGNQRESFGGRGPEVDGSKFRAGRNSRSQKDDDGGPPPQRASLKLAPRSKREDGGQQGATSSNLFGDAKARDEVTWEKKKLPGNNSNSNKGDPNDQRRSSQLGRGRNGGGRGAGSRGGGKGEHNNNTANGDSRRGSQARRNKNSTQTLISPEEKAAAAAAKAAAAATKATETAHLPAPSKPKGPVNSFALLMDDSDSDSD